MFFLKVAPRGSVVRKKFLDCPLVNIMFEFKHGAEKANGILTATPIFRTGVYTYSLFDNKTMQHALTTYDLQHEIKNIRVRS